MHYHSLTVLLYENNVRIILYEHPVQHALTIGSPSCPSPSCELSMDAMAVVRLYVVVKLYPPKRFGLSIYLPSATLAVHLLLLEFLYCIPWLRWLNDASQIEGYLVTRCAPSNTLRCVHIRDARWAIQPHPFSFVLAGLLAARRTRQHHVTSLVLRRGALRAHRLLFHFLVLEYPL